MSYWLYIQAAINLILIGSCLLLYIGLRRARQQGAWKQELTPLVDTLGELLVEVDRIASRDSQSYADMAEVVRAAEAAMTLPEAAPQVAVAMPVEAVGGTPPASDDSGAAAHDEDFGAPLVNPVLALAAQGLEADEIARRLNRPVGEVSLVLGLRAASVTA